MDEETCRLMTDESCDVEKRRIYKNVTIVSLAAMLHFSALDGIGTLQSSINAADGLGTVSSSIINLSTIFTAAILPPIVIRHLGCKETILVSQVLQMSFLVAQWWPSYYTMVPAAILTGLGLSLLWVAVSMYVIIQAKAFSIFSDETVHTVAIRLFGIFFTVFTLCQVLGDFISSTVFFSDGNIYENRTHSENEICGALFLRNRSLEHGVPPTSKFKINSLITTYVGLISVSIFMIMFIVDSLERYEKLLIVFREYVSGKAKLRDVLVLWKNPRLLLMIPYPLLCGLTHAFMQADYTASFITCSLGVSYVGYVMMCYGISTSVACLATGKLVKIFGNVGVLAPSIGAAAVTFGFLLIWNPSQELFNIFLIPVIVIGFCRGIWIVQMKALFGSLFPGEEEAAFSNSAVLECTGIMLSLAYSAFIVTWVKIVVLYIVMALVMFNFVALASNIRRSVLNE